MCARFGYARCICSRCVCARCICARYVCARSRRLRWMTTRRPAHERLYWLVYNIEGKSNYTLPSCRYMLPPLANSVVCLVQIYMIEIDRLKVRPAYQTERRRYAAVCVWMDNPFCNLNLNQPIQPTIQNLSLWAGVISISFWGIWILVGWLD